MRLRLEPLTLVLTTMLTGCPDDTTGDGDTGAATSAGDATEGDATAADTTAGDETAGVDPDGEMLYTTLCSSCHGPTGEGTMLGYEVRHPVRVFSTWVVRNGRPGLEFDGSVMAAYSDAAIPEAQLEAIWDYLDTFPQPTTGEGLYLDYCRNCHGVDALGGVVGVDISDKNFADSIERVRDGGDVTDPGMRPLYMPAFGTDMLSDAEVQLIVDHIATL